MCFSSWSNSLRRRTASAWTEGSSERPGMDEGASERARNCERVGWTLCGQKEGGAEERKLTDRTGRSARYHDGEVAIAGMAAGGKEGRGCASVDAS